MISRFHVAQEPPWDWLQGPLQHIPCDLLLAPCPLLSRSGLGFLICLGRAGPQVSQGQAAVQLSASFGEGTAQQAWAGRDGGGSTVERLKGLMLTDGQCRLAGVYESSACEKTVGSVRGLPGDNTASWPTQSPGPHPPTPASPFFLGGQDTQQGRRRGVQRLTTAGRSSGLQLSQCDFRTSSRDWCPHIGSPKPHQAHHMAQTMANLGGQGGQQASGHCTPISGPAGHSQVKVRHLTNSQSAAVTVGHGP